MNIGVIAGSRMEVGAMNSNVQVKVMGNMSRQWKARKGKKEERIFIIEPFGFGINIQVISEFQHLPL